MKTLILGVEDVRRIVRQVGLNTIMKRMIELLAKAVLDFHPKETVVPARHGFRYSHPEVGLLEWMPVLEVGSQVTIKVVGYHPTNPERSNLPTIISTISAYDCSSGHLVSIADGTFLTALRTGAASAVASRVLALPESTKLGLIGCGAQSVTQLHALTQEFAFSEILIYDVDPDVSRSFLERVSWVDIRGGAVRMATPDQITGSVDILCTSTSVGIGQGPVFQDCGTKPWLHINAVGSDFPGKTEIPLSLLKRSLVCPDFKEQAVAEGECQQLFPEDIGPDLTTLVRESKNYQASQKRSTVFDSTGWALEDQVAMTMLVDYARDLKLGTLVQIESLSNDPKNPYEFLSHGTKGDLTNMTSEVSGVVA